MCGWWRSPNSSSSSFYAPHLPKQLEEAFSFHLYTHCIGVDYANEHNLTYDRNFGIHQSIHLLWLWNKSASLALSGDPISLVWCLFVQKQSYQVELIPVLRCHYSKLEMLYTMLVLVKLPTQWTWTLTCTQVPQTWTVIWASWKL